LREEFADCTKKHGTTTPLFSIQKTPKNNKSTTATIIIILLLALIDRAMAELEPNPTAKRKRGSPPSLEDFYIFGKEVQNCSGQKVCTTMTEERRFHDFFGVGALTAIAAWNLLTANKFVPDDGTILKFLWALFFMKIYPKQGVACSAVGGRDGAVDPKTFRKYAWPFIYALADLESIVVSNSLSWFFFQKKSPHSTNCIILPSD
jgi:hypothetical protein